MKNLSYAIVLGIYWLLLTNTIIDWVAFSLKLTVGANLHALLALPVNSVANVTLSGLKQVLYG